jgi:cytochrome c553
MKKLALLYFFCLSSVLCAQKPSQSEQNKASACTACHGSKGISAQSDWPNLAGQNQKYLIKQLNDLKQGTSRNIPIMSALLTSQTLQDIDDLAAYYAKMPIAQGSTPKKFVQRGEQLYRGGDFTKQITACIACHGPKGTGNAQAGFPVLSGQHAKYTLMQLRAFKEKKRTNDLNHIMQDICNQMNEDDMEAVAHYIEGLH